MHRPRRTTTTGRILVAITVSTLLAVFTASCGQADVVQPTPEALPVEPEPPPEPDPPTDPEPPTESAPPTEPEPEVEYQPEPKGEPAHVVIPAIDVDVPLVRLGLEPDRSMEVPDFGLAGWYIEGPPPGHPGPAVIAAHVDSRAGPDVFYRLGDLVPGDEVHVVYDSGDEVTFVVESSEQAPKDELPVDTIWPITNDRLLALITCGGEFDRSVRHYDDNIIVYTTPLDA